MSPSTPARATEPVPRTNRAGPRYRLLIVTAVEAERDAVLRGLKLPGRLQPPEPAIVSGQSIVVRAAGAGAAAAAAGTARSLVMAELREAPFTAVISAGVAGGFVGRAGVGSTVLASRSVAADLGADSPDGFLPLPALGLGSGTLDADPALLSVLRAALPDTVVGEVLTVCTVTGTQAGATALLTRYPAAVAEAMEGFGVACAAAQAGVAFAELRTVANPVGPRDRDAWRMADALAALTAAAGALTGSAGPLASLVP